LIEYIVLNHSRQPASETSR